MHQRRITKIKCGAKAQTVMNCELALELLLILCTAGILYIPKSHVNLDRRIVERLMLKQDSFV